MENELTKRDHIGVQDFVLLEDYEHPEAFVENLKKRFTENLIYVRLKVRQLISNFLINIHTAHMITPLKFIHQWCWFYIVNAGLCWGFSIIYSEIPGQFLYSFVKMSRVLIIGT